VEKPSLQPPLRQPRMADLIAFRLRDDILNGKFDEGDTLPRHDALFNDFSVSLPAARDAMRILENEGLITVRRGSIGGAVVHQPNASRVARMISMVLQARRGTLDDVSSTLLQLEPMCAGMCATRADRDSEVIPALGAAIEAQREQLDAPLGFNEVSRNFHEVLVAHCGSETMQLLIGALEVVWAGHEASIWEDSLVDYAGDRESDSPISLNTRKASLREHEQIVAAIRAGEPERAIELLQSHLQHSRMTTLNSSGPATIRANLVGAPTTAMGYLV
jgi:GntR family transcriptional repressor for pyruvate dehydrogenase complex